MSQITVNFGWLSTIIVGIDEYHIDNNLILSSVLKKWSTRMNKTLEQMCKCNEMWIIWLLILLLVYKNLIYILLYIALEKVTLLWIKYRIKPIGVRIYYISVTTKNWFKKYLKRRIIWMGIRIHWTLLLTHLHDYKKEIRMMPIGKFIKK